jgi:hypothetical protein
MIDNTEKRAQAGKAAEAGKAAAKGAANAAEGQAKAAAGKLASAFSDLKGDAAALLKGLKDSLGIPTIPKIPKIPAFKQLKKFEPKKAPEPKAFQKEEKKFEYAQAAPVTTPAPRPAPPKGNLSYRYEWDGKRISVMFYQGERYVDPIGALSFKGKVTEERAVELFIESNKAEYPNLVSWGMQKITK